MNKGLFSCLLSIQIHLMGPVFLSLNTLGRM